MPITRSMRKSKKMTKIDESHSSKDLSTKTTTSEDTMESDFMDVMSGDFKDIRPKQAFVDKTMLLKKIMPDKHRSVCLIAPRRFGKSVNLSMLKRFWEFLPDEHAMSENRKLFKGTKIEKECRQLVNKHCGKYPIILLDFLCSKDKITCFGSVLERLRTVVHEAYKEHAYLKSSDELDGDQKKNVIEWCGDCSFESIPITPEKITRALENLAEYLVKHHRHKHQQVIVLVDEYDCICSNAIMNVRDIEEGVILQVEKGPWERRNRKAVDEINEIITLCMGSIGCLLKSNKYVFRGVLTGISYLTTMGLSTLNIFAHKFQEEHDFTPFYGITSKELNEVLLKVSMVPNFKEIQKNYNGYRGEMLCTYTVMCYLNDRGNRKGKNYWVHSGVVVGLIEAFRISAVRSIISYLLSDYSNKTQILCLAKILPRHIEGLKSIISSSTEGSDDSNVNIFLNFLLEQGYLKSSGIDQDESSGSDQKSIIDEDEIIEVQIPNMEIRRELSRILRLFYEFDFKLDLTLAAKCAALFDKFRKKEDNNKKLLEEINRILNQLMNKVELKKQNEATLHHIVFFILFMYSKRFSCFSEIQGGEGRLDLLLLSTKLGIGIIIELKFGKTARDGLEQIIDKNYREGFEDVKYNPKNSKIDYSVFIGLNMCENQKITLCTLLNSSDLMELQNFE